MNIWGTEVGKKQGETRKIETSYRPQTAGKTFDLSSRRLETLQRTQAQCQTLGATSDAYKSCNWPIITLLLDTQVGQCILA
jgi:hypothetical protein